MMHLEFERKDSNLLFVNDEVYNAHIALAAKNCNTVFYGATREKVRRGEKWVVHFQSGVSPERIYFLNQIHEDAVYIAEEPTDPSQLWVADADALITSQKGAALVIRTADCYAIMLAAPGAVAAVHSGWRSTQKNIAAKTVSSLSEYSGCEPSMIRAYIMPGIGAESYEVKNDVAQFFPLNLDNRDDKTYLDLKGVIVNQLFTAGLTRNNVFASFYDTYSFNHLFFSHRRGDEGRNLNYIVLR